MKVYVYFNAITHHYFYLAISDSSSMDGTHSSFDGTCIAPPNNVLLTCVNVDKKIISDDDDNTATIVAIVLPIILTLLLVTIVTMLLWTRFRRKTEKYCNVTICHTHHCIVNYS